MIYSYSNNEGNRRRKLLSESDDIYQTELSTYGTTSFDISDLEDMDDDEHEDFIASHQQRRKSSI